VDLVQIITEVGGELALAVFAIWMLREQMKLRIDDQKENAEEERSRRTQERSELVRVIERNSELWQRATTTMAEVATALSVVSVAITQNEDHVQAIREMLASRPCILRESGAAYESGLESRVRGEGYIPPAAQSSDSALREAQDG